MTPDDLFEAPEYFDRRHDSEKVERRERAKALAERDAPPQFVAPNNRKLLDQIAADVNESRSTRDDAMRLLELIDLAPREFECRLRDFLALRKAT